MPARRIVKKAAPPAPPSPDLVEKLLDDLFKNGAGKPARRLVLLDEDGHDLGGWGRAAVQTKLEAVVASAELQQLRSLVALLQEIVDEYRRLGRGGSYHDIYQGKIDAVTDVITRLYGWIGRKVAAKEAVVARRKGTT